MSLAQEADDLGLYAAAAARSWTHFPHLLRVDGLTTPQAAALREKARMLDIRVAEALPYRHDEEWSEGVMLSADTMSLASLARDLSLTYASVGRALSELLTSLAPHVRHLHFKGGDLLLDPAAGALVMGVLNVTPDSFSDGGQHPGVEAAVLHGLRLAEQGAAIVDVGGESSRPGSEPVPLQEELSRVLPVVRRLRAALPPAVVISIDTMKAEVARQAVQAGAEIINDVSGLAADPAMPETAAAMKAHVILNHMRGNPRTMQDAPGYRHVIPEVIADLTLRMAAAAKAGVETGRILIDPGVGFGKRASDNLAILRHIPAFTSLGHPVVVGLSRKTFLGKVAEDEGAASPGRADSTLAAEVCVLLGGAHIIRTHDAARAARAARIAAAVAGAPRGDEPPPAA